MANLTLDDGIELSAGSVASSATEQVSQSHTNVAPPAPVAEPTAQLEPAQEPQERSPAIPRERFDEVYGKWRSAEDRAKQSEELLTQVLSNYAASQQQASQAQQGYAGQQDPNAEPDVAEQVMRRLSPSLQQMQQTVFGMKDERDRQGFWSDHDMVAPEIQQEVETMLTAFRRQGLSEIKREDLLAHAIGKRQLPTLRAAKAKPVNAPPPANKIAKVEVGHSAAPAKAQKAVDQMTQEEIDALPSEVLFEYLKGRAF